MFFLIPIAGFLLLPLAEKYRNDAIDHLASGSESSLSRWFAAFRGSDPKPDRKALEIQLADDPKLAEDLHTALATVGDIPELPETYAEELPSDSVGELLEGYAQVLYQFALTAISLGRPVAVEGFLQSDNWVAVCQSQATDGMLTYRSGGRLAFPDPATIWIRQNAGGERSLVRSGTYAMRELEYRVRYFPDQAQREAEIARLNGLWWRSASSVLPPRPDRYPPDDPKFRDRWHKVVKVEAGVVPLPAEPQRDFPEPWMRPREGPLRVFPEIPLRYDQYPEELRADFVDVSDGPAALERLQRRLVDIAREDQALRDQVKAALGFSA